MFCFSRKWALPFFAGAFSYSATGGGASLSLRSTFQIPIKSMAMRNVLNKLEQLQATLNSHLTLADE